MSNPERIDFLAGGSEMAKRMREFDFSGTPLGPVSGWPQSLRSAVNICLTTHFPIVLFWGPQLAVLYNDAYIPMLADKHPWALGKTCEAVWNEIFDVIGPLLFEVMKTGVPFSTDDFLFIMQRKGYKEETHFQFSYGAARDESGAVGGIFCVAVEITDRVFHERRLAALSNLKSDAKSPMKAAEDAVQILDCNVIDMPFSLIYLLGKDGKTARLAGRAGLPAASKAAPAAVDLTAEKEKGWPLKQVAASGEAAFVSDLKGLFGDIPARFWPDPPHSAAVLPLMQPGGQAAAGLLVLGISPRRAFDDAYRRFFELASEKITSMIASADAFEQASGITRRKKAEEILTFQAHMIASLQEAICAVDENFNITFWNEMAEKMFGWTAQEAIGRPSKEIFKMISPNREESIANILKNNGYTGEAIYRRKDGKEVHTSVICSVIRDAQRNYKGNVSSFRDITERKQMVDALFEKTKQLDDTNRQKEDILESISDCFYVLDKDLRFTYVNKPAEEIWGLSRTDLIGRKIEDVFPGIIDISLSKFHQALQEKTKQHYEVYSKVIGRWGDMGVYPMRDGISVYFRDTTERKQMEEALRKSEEKYRLLFENMTEVFQILEPIFDDEGKTIDFRYIEINSATENLTGKKRQEIEGKTAKEIWGTVEEYWLEMFDKVIKTGEPVHMENYSRELDAFYDLYAWRTSECKVAIIFTNITDKKRAEKALRESEEKYHVLFDSIDEGFCIVEVLFDDKNRPLDYRFLEVNQAFERQTGLVNASGRFMRDLAPDHEQHWFDIYGRIALTGEPVRFQNPAKALGRFYDVYAFRVGEPGQRRVAILFNDINERRNSEEALRESEMKFKTAFHSNPAAMTLANYEGRYLDVNNSFEELTGYSRDELLGHKSTELNLISPEMRMLHFEELHTAGSFTSPDIEIRCKTGERKWIVTRPVEILLRGQVGYLAFIYDITERKRAEEALHASEKRALALVGELKKADENKNQFISVLSHELRNPLAAILAGIQVLELTQDIGHAREVKEIINRQTKQLCKLVDDLLELTRISQNKIKLKKENINLNEIVKSAAGDIRFEYEKKGVKLEIKIREKPVKLNADPVRVTQAIGNILFNALKFTNASGTVRITLTEEKNDAVISVKDDGIGISQEILAHLFTPFTQADTSLDRKGGGLGLGLSIVKGIVDLHEGSVSAFSEGLGKGSTFTIHLPITPEDDSKAEKLAGGDKSEKRLKLLIIEDNRDFADLLSAMLSMIGHHVDIAYDGIEGVNLAKQIKPDVILCDIGLPGMNGYDVAKSVRNDDGIKDTHLIALTGYAGEDEAERILKAGFDKHLAKPVDFTTLKSLL